MPVGKSYDPSALIESLEFGQLHALQDVAGPWETAICYERSAREHALEGLRTYLPPQTEAPDFGTVDGYMSDARAANHLPYTLLDPQIMTAERGMVLKLATAHLGSIAVQERLSGPRSAVGAQTLTVFFARNLYDLVSTARSVAFHSFGIKRDALLRRRYPDINLNSKDRMISSLLRGRPITPRYAQWVERQVKALTSDVAPYPDFFQLPSEQQEMVTQTFSQEWETLCHVLHEAAPALFKQKVSLRTAPLALLSVTVLQEALRDNPAVNPANICYAFLRTPEDFHNKVRFLKTQVATAALLHRAIADTGLKAEALIQVSETRVMARNGYEILQLLARPDIKAEAQRIAVGQTVTLASAPGTTAQFDEIIDRHLELMGRTYFEDATVHNPRGVRLFRWNEVNPGPVLRDKFAGKLQNLTVTRLAMTEEMLVNRFGQKRQSTTTDNVFYLVLTVEMKSSGKKPETAVLPLLLVMEQDTHDRIFKALLPDKGTGRLVAKSFRAEAAGVAEIVEAYEIAKRPASAGLPGHGKPHR